MKRFLLSYAIFLVVVFHLPISAQSEFDPSQRVRLFLDCDDCDFSYFRRNLEFADFVRDQFEADVHVLVTRQFTASRGRNYRLNFIGLENYESLNYQLEFHSPQDDTDAIRRERLVKYLGLGLMPYIAKTSEVASISIDYERTETTEAREPEDSWNYWVFRLGLGIGLQAQDQQNEIALDGFLRADRITEMSKFRSRYFLYYNEENFKSGSEEIKGIRRFNEWENEMIFSLSERWSVGGFTSVYSSTFRNIDLGFSLAPAIEYNIFPWDQSDRKVLAIAYFVGLRHFDYLQTTLFGREQELRSYESLRLQLILRQPWGEVEASMEGFHYFHDLSRYRMTLDTELSIRITKGLSVYSELRLESIHDQIYLARGDASLDEILLRQRQLATTFEIGIDFGFRYTFGSIYNNVVNPRL